MGNLIPVSSVTKLMATKEEASSSIMGCTLNSSRAYLRMLKSNVTKI